MEHAMAYFTELPVYEGVDDWHFNRFRIAFEAPEWVTEEQGRGAFSPPRLFTNLRDNFPTYINSAYATAKWGDKDHNGRRTIHFHGYAEYLGIDVGQPHTDWVAIIDSNAVSFTVQTLKREFWDTKEDLETSVGILAIPIVGAVVAVGSAIGGAHYNRMHFLAGRRAWRIDNGSVFGLSNDVMVLETAAVERFSAHVFNMADSVIGLEKRLPNVWLSFLNNFVNQMGLKPVDQAPKPRWKKDMGAMHIELPFTNQVNLMGDPEFVDANKLYLSLLPKW